MELEKTVIGGRKMEGMEKEKALQKNRAFSLGFSFQHSAFSCTVESHREEEKVNDEKETSFFPAPYTLRGYRSGEDGNMENIFVGHIHTVVSPLPSLKLFTFRRT